MLTYTIRGVPWYRIAPLAGIAIAVVLVPALSGRDRLGGSVIAAVLLAGSLFAFAFDAPARPIIDASPIGSPRRQRLAMLVLGAAAVLLLAAVAVVVRIAGSGLDELDLRVGELAAVAGVGTAVASRRHRDGATTVNIDVALVGPLAILFVSALAQRVAWLPSVGLAENAALWWPVAVVTSAAALWWARDGYAASFGPAGHGR